MARTKRQIFPEQHLAGVTVTLDQGNYHAVTATAGGFVLPPPTSGAGTLTVIASGGPLGGLRVKTVVWTTGTNVKMDFTPANPVAMAALPVVSLSAPTRNGPTGLVTVFFVGQAPRLPYKAG